MIIPVFNEYRRLNFTVDVAIWIRLGLILYGIYRQIPGSSETTRKRKKSVFFNSRSLPPLSSYPIICYLFSYSSPRQMEFLWGGSKNGGYVGRMCIKCERSLLVLRKDFRSGKAPTSMRSTISLSLCISATHGHRTANKIGRQALGRFMS